MDLFWDSTWLLWVTSIWSTIQWSAFQAAQQRRLFWSINNSKALEPQMATNTIYSYIRWFWCVVYGQKIRKAPGFSSQNYHEISKDWEGKKIAGIDLIWDYTHNHIVRTCRLSMKIYIGKLLFKVGYKLPVKKQLFPHRFGEIVYGSKMHKAPEEYSYPALD